MSESSPSTPTLTPDLIESAKADKVGLAILLQRGQQNLKVDQEVQESNRRFRENNQRLFESRMEKFGAKGVGSQEGKPGEDMGEDVGNILIDSPTTENHYHQVAPAEPKPAPTTTPVAPTPSTGIGTLGMLRLAAALAAGGGGLGFLASTLLNRPSPPDIQRIENTTGLGHRIELVPKATP